jgi:hypothetical protein
MNGKGEDALTLEWSRNGEGRNRERGVCQSVSHHRN